MAQGSIESSTGWTLDTLSTYFDRRLTDLTVMLEERHQTLTKNTDAAFTAHEKAMLASFMIAEKANEKAREADQKAVVVALQAAEKAVDRRQDTLDKEFHEHLEQVRHENALAFLNSDKAVAAALASAKEAVTKSEARYDARFVEANHIREQLADQALTFLPREVAETAMAELRSGLTSVTDRMNTMHGRSTGYSQLYGWAIAGVGIIVSVVLLANSLGGS